MLDMQRILNKVTLVSRFLLILQINNKELFSD